MRVASQLEMNISDSEQIKPKSRFYKRKKYAPIAAAVQKTTTADSADARTKRMEGAHKRRHAAKSKPDGDDEWKRIKSGWTTEQRRADPKSRKITSYFRKTIEEISLDEVKLDIENAQLSAIAEQVEAIQTIKDAGLLVKEIEESQDDYLQKSYMVQEQYDAIRKEQSDEDQS